MLTAVLMMVLCGTVYGARPFTVEGLSDYETVEVVASWWPDPNGGLGVLFATDSSTAKGTDENFAIGPCITFSLSKAAASLLGTVLPAVTVPEDIPVEVYGRGAVTWDINNDGLMTFRGATGIVLTENATVQPAVWAEYVKPEGGDRELRALFGVTVRLGKQ